MDHCDIQGEKLQHFRTVSNFINTEDGKLLMWNSENSHPESCNFRVTTIYIFPTSILHSKHIIANIILAKVKFQVFSKSF